MRTLFLDLLSQNGILACVTPQEVVSSFPVHERIADDALPSRTLEVVREAGWSMQDLQAVACVTGPGGFTGQRVAVTFVNTLAWGLKLPSAGVHLADLWGARVGRHGEFAKSMTQQQPPAWLHSTKRDALFVRRHAQDAPELTSLQDLLASAPFVFTGELLPEHETALSGRSAVRAVAAPLVDVLPRVCAELSYARRPLEPWYGRGI